MPNNSYTTAGSTTIPQTEQPLVDEGGRITSTWFRFLVALYNKTGGSSGITNLAYLTYSAGNVLSAYKAIGGTLLGSLLYSNAPGGTPVPQNPTTSPFTFTASTSGHLLVSSGQVTIKRQAGGTPYLIGDTGGYIGLTNGDIVSVVWYGAGVGNVPTIVWFPGI